MSRALLGLSIVALWGGVWASSVYPPGALFLSTPEEQAAAIAAGAGDPQATTGMAYTAGYGGDYGSGSDFGSGYAAATLSPMYQSTSESLSPMSSGGTETAGSAGGAGSGTSSSPGNNSGMGSGSGSGSSSAANTLPTITSLTFNKSIVTDGRVYGSFDATLEDDTPSDTYSIEIDADTESIVFDGDNSYYIADSNLSGTAVTVRARAVELVSWPWQSADQYAYGEWQEFTVSDGVQGTGGGSPGGSNTGSGNGVGSNTGGGNASSASSSTVVTAEEVTAQQPPQGGQPQTPVEPPPPADPVGAAGSPSTPAVPGTIVPVVTEDMLKELSDREYEKMMDDLAARIVGIAARTDEPLKGSSPFDNIFAPTLNYTEYMPDVTDLEEYAKILLDKASADVIINHTLSISVNNLFVDVGSTGENGQGPCYHYARHMEIRLKKMVAKLPLGVNVEFDLYNVDVSKLPLLPNGSSPVAKKHIILKVTVPGKNGAPSKTYYYDAGTRAISNANMGNNITGEISKEAIDAAVASGALTLLRTVSNKRH